MFLHVGKSKLHLYSSAERGFVQPASNFKPPTKIIIVLLSSVSREMIYLFWSFWTGLGVFQGKQDAKGRIHFY